jgi:putative transcriptional regulator
MSTAARDTTTRGAGASGPFHHVPDEELLDHVTGRQGEAVGLAIACHLTLCARCREEARRLEGIGGALLDAASPARMSAGALEAAMARLDAAPLASEDAPGSGATWPDGERLGVPRGVGALLAPRLPDGPTRWRYIAPGIRGVNVTLTEAPGAGATDAGAPGEIGTVRVVRLRPGLVIPEHGHRTTELTLVLTGALVDVVGRFAPGDLSIRKPGDTHIQRVEAGGECLALVINGDGLIPMTPLGHLIRWIARP